MIDGPQISRGSGVLDRHGGWLLAVVAVVLAADVIWLAVSYLVYPGFLDHGEPVVAMISWRLLDGAQAYPAFDGPALTTNIYGPITYLTHALMFLAAGPGVAASKAAGFLAAVSVPVVVALSQKRHGWRWALAAFVLAAGFIVVGVPTSVWNRPDPFLALLVAISVWAVNGARAERPDWHRTAMIALAAGLAAGFKLHAGLYFVPVVVLYCWHRGTMTFLALCAISAAVIALPFAFEPFSLAGFLAWFPLVTGKEMSPGVAAKVLRYLLFYLMPVLFFAAALRTSGTRMGKAEKAYFGAFIVCIAGVLTAAVKPGAGWYYFFPFLAVVVDMIVRFSAPALGAGPALRAAVGVLAAVLIVVSVPVQKRFQRALHWDDARRITAEIGHIMAAYRGHTIQMGAGDSLVGYNNTLYKPLLVFAGHPYTLDVGVAIETTGQGVPISTEVRRRIENCHTQVWLVPKGQAPFQLVGYYGNPVFDAAFRGQFQRTYEKQESFRYFDAWVCVAR